jgi:hypothetical protein
MSNEATGGLYSRAEGKNALSHLYGGRTRQVFEITQRDESSGQGSAQIHEVFLAAESPDTANTGEHFLTGDYSEFFLDGVGGSERLIVPANCAWNYTIEMVANGKYPSTELFNIVSPHIINGCAIWNDGTELRYYQNNPICNVKFNHSQNISDFRYYDMDADTITIDPSYNYFADNVHASFVLCVDPTLGALRMFVREQFANCATVYVAHMRIIEIKYSFPSTSSS